MMRPMASARVGLVLVVAIGAALLWWWRDPAGSERSAEPDSAASVPAPGSPEGGSAPTPVFDAEGRLAELLAALPAGRSPGTEGHAATRALLSGHARDVGRTLRELRVPRPLDPARELVNLELRLGSAEDDAPIVLACAHYDTIPGSPGADDNGAAVAVLMVLAERLAAVDADAEIRLVWFDAEEEGLVGSMAYAAALDAGERERLVGVVNLECVGFTDRRPGTQRMPAGVSLFFDPGDVGDFLLVASNLASRPFQQRVVDAMRRHESEGAFRIEEFGYIPGPGLVLPDIRRSDHAPFWDIGVPAVLLTDTANFRNPHYHRASDRVQTLDLPFLAGVARGVEAAVADLAGVRRP